MTENDSEGVPRPPETHVSGIDDELKQAWGRVSDEIGALGLKLKLHVEQQFGPFEHERGAEWSTDMRDALDRAAGFVDKSVGAAGAAAKDKAVRDDVKETGARFFDALASTFDAAAAGIRDLADRERAGDHEGEG